MQLVTILGLASLCAPAIATSATIFSGERCDGDQVGTIELSGEPEGCNTPGTVGGSMRIEGGAGEGGKIHLLSTIRHFVT